VYGATSKIEVSKEYWSKQHKKKVRDTATQNFQKDIIDQLFDLERHILSCFQNTVPTLVNKKWLTQVVEDYYNPALETDIFPKDLVNYMDTYVEYKKNDVTVSTQRKIRVVQELVKRFQEHKGNIIFIKDINLQFRKDFDDYCRSTNYKHNTIARAVRYIKTVCRHAKTHGLETHNQLDGISIKYEKSQPIYLTPQEINNISELDNLVDHLDNVRDWFLISYYTGQRISDFMRFESTMIRQHQNKAGELKLFIEFTQHKTKKLMTIPLSSNVIEILDKRNGEFPRKISDQKYNTYLKTVCREAKITQLVEGNKVTETEIDSGLYRSKMGLYEKCELVSSHIGRYSFATNNYANIPTSVLSKMTGHTTEAMFLNYIGKSSKDMAIEISSFFE
jgi:integrase